MISFSVIIPLYNKANYIESCLNSVLKQTHQDFEVIIVNDGSTDGSEKIVEKFNNPNIRMISQENKGASSARNKGIANANYNWIALLDADDYWYPNHLEELQKTSALLPKANVLCMNYEILLQQSYLKQPKFSIDIKPDHCFYVENYFEASFIDPLAWTSAIAFKVSTFNDVGGFDTRIKSGQDIDLMVKFGLSTSIAFNPKITMRYHRTSENNLSDMTDLREKLSYINNHLNEEKVNNSLKKFMDINRFSLGIQAKMTGDLKLFNELKEKIDISNLNFKQRLLFHLSGRLLLRLKLIQRKLIQKKMYKSPFT